jgi:GNAT superfamily N-acetyltransferase
MTNENIEIVIRNAGPADAAVIVEFNRLLALESEGKTLDARELALGVDAILGDPALGRYFVAVAGGRIVGQMMITYEWSDWRNGMIWWLQSVYVEPGHRRRGVFRRLFEHVHGAAAADPGIAGLRLYVENGNRAAIETYIRLGLAEAGYRVLEQIPLRPPPRPPDSGREDR